MSYETIAIRYRLNKEEQNGVTLGQTILNCTDCLLGALFNLALQVFYLLPLVIMHVRLIGANLTTSEKICNMYAYLPFSPFSYGSRLKNWERRILNPKPLIASYVTWLLYLKSTSTQKYEREL